MASTCLFQHLYHFLCFRLCECYFLDFFECLILFSCILACTSTVSVFVAISMLSHAWNVFTRMIVDSTTCFTHMHVDLFTEYFIQYFHECNHLFFHLVLPCIHFHICFQLPIGESVQPWPGIYLHRDNIAQSGVGLVFLSRNAHFYLGTVLQDCFVHFLGTVIASPENCAMQSLSM